MATKNDNSFLVFFSWCQVVKHKSESPITIVENITGFPVNSDEREVIFRFSGSSIGDKFVKKIISIDKNPTDILAYNEICVSEMK